MYALLIFWQRKGGDSMSSKALTKKGKTQRKAQRSISVMSKKDMCLAFAKYASYFVMMILLSLAKSTGGLAPFVLGFFAGLVYCRENVFILSLEYLVAIIITGFSMQNLVISFVAPIVFIVAKILHKVFLRPMKMLHINIYAMLCQLPVILLDIADIRQVIHAVLACVISQIFTYTVTIFLYATIVRGAKYKFAKDEIFGGVALIIALSIGLFSLSAFNVMPFYLISTFALMMTIFSGSVGASFVTALSLGVGAGLQAGNIMLVGGLLIPTGLALVFAKSNIYYASMAYLIGDIFAGMYFNAFGRYDIYHFAVICVGLLLFLFIPKNAKQHFIHLFGGGESKNAEHSVVLRNRREVGGKLEQMAKVFSQIGGVLGGSEFVVSANNSLELAGEIAVECCSKCPNYKFCSAMLGGNTTVAIKDAVDKAMYNGLITVEDLSPFLQSRCTKQAEIVGIVSDRSAKLARAVEKRNQIGAGRIILGEQMLSLSSLLAELGGQIKSAVVFDTKAEDLIANELNYHNIVCRDIVVSGENGVFGVTLTVRHKDSSKVALPSVVGKILQSDFEVVDCTQSDISGFDVVRLLNTPQYSIVYGVATCTMEGSPTSGDTFSVNRVDYDKLMLVLCDGMGSGDSANFNSTSTIGMIENFYKAGFKNNAILSLINKILATYNNENFTCLDMAMIDLTAGVMDIIKLGGAQSLIIRQDKCIAMGGGALPLGIVEEAQPYTDRHILMAGDIIVMFTDGISDYLKREAICDMIMSNLTGNPEQLANDILHTATAGGAKDDSTVIVARVIRREKNKFSTKDGCMPTNY